MIFWGKNNKNEKLKSDGVYRMLTKASLSIISKNLNFALSFNNGARPFSLKKSAVNLSK